MTRKTIRIDEMCIRDSNNSGRVFLALAHYSNGDADLAVSTLLAVLLETTKDEDILGYADALDYYKDNLDETLDG